MGDKPQYGTFNNGQANTPLGDTVAVNCTHHYCEQPAVTLYVAIDVDCFAYCSTHAALYEPSLVDHFGDVLAARLDYLIGENHNSAA
jgi:hypothetical protein